MIPAHVQHHRIRAGLIDHRGVGPKARPGHCAHCGLAVLAGWADGHGPDTAVVHPAPLTAEGELWAILAGWTTWTVNGFDGILERRRAYASAGPDDLTNRLTTNIAANTADQLRVYAEHRCGTVPPPTRPDVAVRTASAAAPPF